MREKTRRCPQCGNIMIWDYDKFRCSYCGRIEETTSENDTSLNSYIY